MENRAVPAPTAVPTMEVVSVIEKLAPVVAASKMFNVTPAQAAVIMLKGYELGFGLATAFEFIHVIKDRPGVSPKGMMALIHRSGDVDVKIRRIPEDRAQPLIGYECWMRRKSTGIEHRAVFTMKDAERAGLIKPESGWQRYPENMCMWRAVGFAADVVCPDLGGGLLRLEELESANGDRFNSDDTPAGVSSLGQEESVVNGEISAPPGETIEEQIALAMELQQHWIDDPTKRKLFWAKVGEMGLDERSLKELVGIEHIHDWQGSASELLNLAKQKLAGGKK